MNLFGVEFCRNQGLFWEPGVLQIYLNLFFFLQAFILKQNRWLFLIGFVILGTYSTTGILILIAIIYGATILKIGYFLTTSLFLFASYYFLGERRWFLMFLLSFPFVAAFMYLLHGVLDIYLRDPFLKMIGVMG